MYYFSEVNYRGNHAGTKARNDVEKILRQIDAEPINSKPLILKTDDSSMGFHSNIQSRFDYIRYFFDAKKIKNKVIFIQYPMLTFDMAEKYIRTLTKKNSVVFLIHDVHGLRQKDMEATKKEIEILNMGDAVIVHNRFMEDKLKSQGLRCPRIFRLDIFDYLSDVKKNDTDSRKLVDVVFAGNLEKSSFVEEFVKENPDVSIHLYGIGWKEEWKKYINVSYSGNFTPDEITAKLDGRYGLVWDGEDIRSGCGTWGEYTKINNPHKLSLYMAAGIPVIAWREAAIAEYIEKNCVGLVVDSLENLREIIDGISSEEYKIFCENVEKVRKEITLGLRLKGIIKKLQ